MILPAGATTDTAPNSLYEGRYRIERIIGEGAFGRVYLAFDTRLQRNVAIKELLTSWRAADRAAYEDALARFEREARAGGMIDHPNVTAVHDLHVSASGDSILVMEYVDGMNLRDLLAQVGTLPLERAVAIARDIARALEAVHQRDIVHRDIKPANIMLTRRGTAKLTDFGIAQVGHESMRTHLATGHPGTPTYMSPEQASGSSYVDGRSDLYSLGLVLYEMLAGEPYARTRQPIGTARPDLPPHLIAIIEKMTAAAPEARYQSASDVLHDLEGLETLPPAPAVLEHAPPVPVATEGGAPAATGGQPATTPARGPTAPAVAAATPAAPAPPAPAGPPARQRMPVGIIGIAGGIVLLIAALIVVVAIRPWERGTPTATATVSAPATAAPATQTIAPTAPVAAVSTPAPTMRASVPPTPAPATSAQAPRTVVPGTPAPPTTWTDPQGRIRLVYPGNWQVFVDPTVPTIPLELNGSDDTGLIMEVYDLEPGMTVPVAVREIRDGHAESADSIYADGPVTDTTVGGEPAQTFPYTYAAASAPKDTINGRVWVVIHGNMKIILTSKAATAHEAEIDAIIASIRFLT